LDQVEAWLDILDHASYYELLGILEIADDTAIKTAFYEFSENFHPDRHRSQPAELVAAITKIYQRGAEAYGVLRNPRTRAQYDLALTQGALRFNPGQTQSEGSGTDLVSLAVTKAGQLHARQLERALAAGSMEEALDLLRKALLSDGGNPALEQRGRDLLALVEQGQLLPHCPVLGTATAGSPQLGDDPASPQFQKSLTYALVWVARRAKSKNRTLGSVPPGKTINRC